MGDSRFGMHYDRVRDAMESGAGIERLTDEEVIAALAAASRAHNPYLANVLANAAVNRVRRLGTATRNIGEGVCVLDREGSIASMNPAAERLLLWRSGEAVGGHFHTIVHADRGRAHAAAGDCDLAAALETAEPARRGEDRFARKDGGAFPTAYVVSPILIDGTPDGTVILFRDVSEERKREALVKKQTQVLESAIRRAMRQIEERQRAEERFRALFDASPDALVITDAEGVISMVNPRVEEAFGYSREELVGERGDLLLPERLRPAGGRAPAFAAPAGAAVGRIELLGRRKDGTEFPIEVSVAPIAGPAGPLLVTSIRDTTARHLAEEKRLRSESLLREAERLAGLGCWEWDIRANRVMWSDEMYRVYGFEPGAFEVTFEAFLSLVHPEDRGVARAAIEDALRLKRAFDFDHRIVLPDGSVRHLHGHGNIVLDGAGHPVRMFGTGQDITARKLAEERLRRSEHTLSEVLQTVHEGIAIVGPNGAVTFVNPAARIIGGSPGVASVERFDASGTRPADPAGEPFRLHEGLFHRVAHEGEQVRDLELAIEKPDGTRSFIVLNASPLRSDGSGGGAVVSFHDVTALKRTELELRRLAKGLEERVAERTRSLATANHELEAFSYSVSHDLQAPLRSLEVLSHILLDEEAGPLSAEAREHVERMASEAARMRQLVLDLLELSRINASDVRTSLVDVAEAARAIMTQLRREAPERHIEFQAPEELEAVADPNLVNILLTNLLGNAVKYTATREVARVELGVEDEEGDEVFFVRDNGVGFDPDQAARLFEPFVRLHSRERFDGTGIGLTTVKRVVEKHGGRVWAEGAPGVGATFRFTLPRARSEGRERPPAEGPAGGRAAEAPYR